MRKNIVSTLLWRLLLILLQFLLQCFVVYYHRTHLVSIWKLFIIFRTVLSLVFGFYLVFKILGTLANEFYGPGKLAIIFRVFLQPLLPLVGETTTSCSWQEQNKLCVPYKQCVSGHFLLVTGESDFQGTIWGHYCYLLLVVEAKKTCFPFFFNIYHTYIPGYITLSLL